MWHENISTSAVELLSAILMPWFAASHIPIAMWIILSGCRSWQIAWSHEQLRPHKSHWHHTIVWLKTSLATIYPFVFLIIFRIWNFIWHRLWHHISVCWLFRRKKSLSFERWVIIAVLCLYALYAFVHIDIVIHINTRIVYYLWESLHPKYTEQPAYNRSDSWIIINK